ncbi:hypothetical protein [Oceanobacillus jeddahense]|uniref:hypothetical protein n=1 Tax=Oceanobacillus jeddahense TaxID=1462527 RepID=UPI0011DCAD98|nr:hypothetical protein [Oceanobacillus jeddahense]
MNKRVTFVSETDGYYDPEKGEWIPGELDEKTLPCNANKLGIESTNQIFGQIDKKMSVIRLQRPYYKDFEYLYLGDKKEQKYQVKRQSDHRKGVFYVEGEV